LVLNTNLSTNQLIKYFTNIKYKRTIIPQLYVRIGILLNQSINQLINQSINAYPYHFEGKVWAHKTCLYPATLKYLCEARKVNSQVNVYYGYRFCPFLLLSD